MDDSFKPDDLTYWVWAHHSYADLELWQNCLLAAREATNGKGHGPYIDVADKMYYARGGQPAKLRARAKRKKSAGENPAVRGRI